MNENEIYVLKGYIFVNPLITKIGSITNSCYRDCRHNFFHKIKNECFYDFELTNITNNAIINLTNRGKSMNLYELNNKLKFARHNGFIFNQISNLTIKFYPHLRYINIGYYLKLQTPIMHRQFFKTLSQNCDYVKNHCNDMENPFHFACQKWINQLN